MMSACFGCVLRFGLVRAQQPKRRNFGRCAAQESRGKVPDEIEELRGENGDWQHGFNSGQLVMSRLVLGIMGAEEDAKNSLEDDARNSYWDPNPEPPRSLEGEMEQMVQWAIDEYPMLDC